MIRSTPRRSVGAGIALAPDRGDLLAYPSKPAPLHEGAYTWHRADLSEAHALGATVSGRLSLTSPSGEKLDFRYQRHIEHPSGDWTWIGESDQGGIGQQAIITFGERAAFGSIDQAGKPALKLTMRDGKTWLVETDPVKLALTENRGDVEHEDYLIPTAALGSSTASSNFTPQAINVAATANASTTIDVLVGYSNGYAAGLGGQSQALTRINNLVDITNQAYVNSQITARIRLVHAMQVNYPDNSDNGDTLEKLTGTRTVPVDAAFNALRAARDQYGADLVSFVRKYDRLTQSGCGIAWLIGGGRQAYTASSAGNGYSVVSDGRQVDGNTSYFCRDESFAHELGHNMGAQHDRATASSGGSLSYGAFDYSFGYKTDANSGNFYDIMAYGDSGQTAYRVFSNPRVSTCGGRACGVENQADNARTLDQTMPIAATFRATVVSPAVPSVSVVQSIDYNGDGKSDITWYNSDVQQISYWLMNGAVVAGRGDLFSGGQFRVITTGDFNGDGRGDFLWRGPGGNLELWFSGANGITSRQLGMYPAGWELVDAMDLDGDRKSDLVWYNAGAQQVAYWILDGATITRRGDWISGGNFRIISTGDYNGDGKSDLLWKAPGENGVLEMWFSNGVGYTSRSFGSYPAGWELIGSLNIDGDARSDLVWYNPGAQQISYWILNGASVTRRGDWFSGGDYRVIATGDYNGDGRSDLVWKAPGASGVMEIWFSNGTGYTSGSLGNYPAGWTMLANRP